MLVEVQVMHRPLPRGPSRGASFALRKLAPRGRYATCARAGTRV